MSGMDLAPLNVLITYAWAAAVVGVFLVPVAAVNAVRSALRRRKRRKAMPRAERAHLSREHQKAWAELVPRMRADSKDAERGAE